MHPANVIEQAVHTTDVDGPQAQVGVTALAALSAAALLAACGGGDDPPAALRNTGAAVAMPDLQRPPVEWRGGNTYIQKDGINHDFGVFNDPDAFYARHGANLSGFKRWLFQAVVRRWMNRNVARIRDGG